jgi:hypothetical protein
VTVRFTIDKNRKLDSRLRGNDGFGGGDYGFESGDFVFESGIALTAMAVVFQSALSELRCGHVSYFLLFRQGQSQAQESFTCLQSPP